MGKSCVFLNVQQSFLPAGTVPRCREGDMEGLLHKRIKKRGEHQAQVYYNSNE